MPGADAAANMALLDAIFRRAEAALPAGVPAASGSSSAAASAASRPLPPYATALSSALLRITENFRQESRE